LLGKHKKSSSLRIWHNVCSFGEQSLRESGTSIERSWAYANLVHCKIASIMLDCGNIFVVRGFMPILFASQTETARVNAGIGRIRYD